jgi:trk system potassium uptake protein TrkA
LVRKRRWNPRIKQPIDIIRHIKERIKMGKHKSSIEFGIIGLGRFGTSLATTLAEAKREVLILDNNENKIKQIRHLTDNALVVGELTKEALEQAGIQNCETVIICIAEKADVSILTTLNVISMGVPRVIAKALSPEQGSVLEKLGAEVIYPEHDMAIRLANRLIFSRVMDYITLKDDITITELKLTDRIAGQSVVKSGIRQKFKLNIIALVHDNKTTTDITEELVLHENDNVVVVGKEEHIKKFEAFLVGR